MFNVQSSAAKEPFSNVVSLNVISRVQESHFVLQMDLRDNPNIRPFVLRPSEICLFTGVQQSKE